MVRNLRAGELFTPRAGSVWCAEDDKKIGIVASARVNKKGFQPISYEDLDVGAPVQNVFRQDKFGMFKKLNGQAMAVIGGPNIVPVRTV